jgi:hypothetical protein
MSELQPEGFDSVRPVLVEPEVVAAFELVAEYQQELDENPSVGVERRREIIHELDNRWPHFDERVYASGTLRGQAYVLDRDDEGLDDQPHYNLMVKTRDDETPALEDYIANEEALTSKGFAIEPEPQYVGGYFVGNRYIIRLLFQRQHEIATPEGNRAYTVTDGVTGLPDQVSLEFSRDTPELCEAICKDYFPEAADRLIGVASDESLSVSQKILALGDLRIPYEPYITDREIEALSEFATECLETEYESKPYFLEPIGNSVLFLPDDEGLQSITTIDDSTHIIDIFGVRARQAVKVKHDGEGHTTVTPLKGLLELRIAVRLLGYDSTYDSEKVEIRFHDLLAMRNIRDLMRAPCEAEDETENEETTDG